MFGSLGEYDLPVDRLLEDHSGRLGVNVVQADRVSVSAKGPNGPLHHSKCDACVDRRGGLWVKPVFRALGHGCGADHPESAPSGLASPAKPSNTGREEPVVVSSVGGDLNEVPCRVPVYHSRFSFREGGLVCSLFPHRNGEYTTGLDSLVRFGVVSFLGGGVGYPYNLGDGIAEGADGATPCRDDKVGGGGEGDPHRHTGDEGGDDGGGCPSPGVGELEDLDSGMDDGGGDIGLSLGQASGMMYDDGVEDRPPHIRNMEVDWND